MFGPSVFGASVFGASVFGDYVGPLPTLSTRVNPGDVFPSPGDGLLGQSALR